MFLKTNEALGTIKAGKEVTMEFPYDDNISYIKEIRGCNCASVYNVASKKQIVLKYIPTFPKHLKEMNQTQFHTNKNFIVTAVLKDGTDSSYTLSFEAIVIQ
jgi:hypothetical protein